MALLGGGSLGRAGVDRLAQFPDRRWNVVAMEVQRGRGGTSIGDGSLVAWRGGAPSRWRRSRGGFIVEASLRWRWWNANLTQSTVVVHLASSDQ
jgi:hypothetical protein